MKIKTINNMGSMSSWPNPALNLFLDLVEKTQGYFADIGTSYGYSSIEALKRGGKVLAIDLDQRHLDSLKENCPTDYLTNLETNCGHFPNEISLPLNTFDGILISRVLIFLTPQEISLALNKIYQALKAGGILFVTSPSPLRDKWRNLKAIYDQQKLEGLKWPGKIQNLWQLVPETKISLPNEIQLIDKDSLERELTKHGFNVRNCGYYPEVFSNEEELYNLTYAIASKLKFSDV